MKEIFFSLIVPVYNVSEYLRDCLDSIVKLRGDNYQVVIVNDGSSDDSERICREYVERYPFIKYYFKENGGLSSARNFGIDKADGDYLLFIDSDDFLLNDDFIIKVSKILKKDYVDLIGFLPIEFNGGGKEVLKKHALDANFVNKVVKAGDFIDELYSSLNPYITMAQTKIINKKYLINHGLYFEDNIYHEDDEWIARVLLTEPVVVFSDIEEYGYRRREGSIITSKDKVNKIKKCFDKVKIANKLLGIADIYKYKRCVTYFIEYYLQAVSDICAYDDQNQLYIENAGDNNVFSSLRYSASKKHRLLYIYFKLFGKKSTKKYIVRKLRHSD